MPDARCLFSAVLVLCGAAAPAAAATCQGPAAETAAFICKAVQILPGVECDFQANCDKAQREIFTGTTIELASPTNIKSWNGFGGVGAGYSLVPICLLRDLGKSGVGPLTAETEGIDLGIGTGKVTHSVHVLGYDPNPKARKIDGLHRAQLCFPALGCLDFVDQPFTLTEVETPVKGHSAGQYEIRATHALALTADTLDQRLDLIFPALPVMTPFGKLEVNPKLYLERHTHVVSAPFFGDNFNSVIPPGVQMRDVVSSEGGLLRSERPAQHQPQGWISQAGLGGRSAPEKDAVWMPNAEWPPRPDDDLATARSHAEKQPNFLAGLDVKVVYKPLELLPPALLQNPLLEEPVFEVFVTPTLQLRASSQLDVWNAESVFFSAPPPPPPVNPPEKGSSTIAHPLQFEQGRALGIYSGASLEGKFVVTAGFKIRLALDVPFSPLTIIDLQGQVELPKGGLTKPGFTPPNTRKAVAFSSSSQALQGKAFTVYQTFADASPSPDPTAHGATHIKQCLEQKQAEKFAAPPPPSYQPGTPADLLEDVLQVCNLCIAWGPKSYVDKNGETVTIPPFAKTISPVPPVSWFCDMPKKAGCLDLCSVDAAGKSTVVKTAVQLFQEGKAEFHVCDDSLIN